MTAKMCMTAIGPLPGRTAIKGIKAVFISFEARTASEHSGTIEIRLDSQDGMLAGTVSCRRPAGCKRSKRTPAASAGLQASATNI